MTWAVVWGPLRNLVGQVEPDPLRAILGGGATALIVTYLIRRALPKWLTNSFVDVVRYLDTSPRSYQVRKEIRAGIVDLLREVHEYGRYERVVVVAHSLGSYIAYDAITHLWAEMAKLHQGPLLPKDRAGGCRGGKVPEGLAQLEAAASAVEADPGRIDEYQDAQRSLWRGLRLIGNPWLITDFISFGSPMYFADRLYTRNRNQFKRRVEMDELPSCPPQVERRECNNIHDSSLFYSWNNRGHRILHDAAPFAVVRWTNLWYPSVMGFFGDWFGGRLAPVFGNGIRDIPVRGNRPWRMIPGAAHALYLGFPDDRETGSFTAHLADALDINAARWLPDDPPAYDPDTALMDSTARED